MQLLRAQTVLSSEVLSECLGGRRTRSKAALKRSTHVGAQHHRPSPLRISVLCILQITPSQGVATARQAHRAGRAGPPVLTVRAVADLRDA